MLEKKIMNIIDWYIINTRSPAAAMVNIIDIIEVDEAVSAWVNIFEMYQVRYTITNNNNKLFEAK